MVPAGGSNTLMGMMDWALVELASVATNVAVHLILAGPGVFNAVTRPSVSTVAVEVLLLSQAQDQS